MTTPYSHYPADADHHSGTADTDSYWSSDWDTSTAHTVMHKGYRRCFAAVLVSLVLAAEGNSYRADDTGPARIALKHKARTDSCP